MIDLLKMLATGQSMNPVDKGWLSLALLLILIGALVVLMGVARFTRKRLLREQRRRRESSAIPDAWSESAKRLDASRLDDEDPDGGAWRPDQGPQE